MVQIYNQFNPGSVTKARGIVSRPSIESAEEMAVRIRRVCAQHRVKLVRFFALAQLSSSDLAALERGQQPLPLKRGRIETALAAIGRGEA